MSETDSAYPWMMFFPADHLADSGLRLCSLSARGLWTEMLCFMYGGEPHGYLCRNGKPITIPQLARLVGAAEDEVERNLNELRHNGVFSEDTTGIFSRRILRDATRRERNRANGRLGGNPQLIKRDNKGVNPSVKPEDKAQKPKIKSQRPRSRTPDTTGQLPASPTDQNSAVSRTARNSISAGAATKLAEQIVAVLGESIPESESTVATSHRWIVSGWLPEIILSTIAGIQSRESSAGQVRALKYYERAIANAHKRIVRQ